jgi:DNA polymerase III subunit delta'
MLFDEYEVETDDTELDQSDALMALNPSAGKPSSFLDQTSRTQYQLLGHEIIEQDIIKQFNNKRLPHGLIFSGAQGIGKSSFAFRLARFLLAQSYDELQKNLDSFDIFSPQTPDEPRSLIETLYISPEHPVSSLVASSGHPDLLVIERPVDEKTGERKNTLPVEDIRKIAPFLRKKPSVDNGWRIALVDDADLMTNNSQNALLKILEEPPEKSLLILIVSRIGVILPTIFSRTSHYNFMPLPSDILEDSIKDKLSAVPSALHSLLIDMAAGSLGRAMQLLDERSIIALSHLLEILNSLPNFQSQSIESFAEEYGSKKAQDSFMPVLKIFTEWLFASLIRQKSLGHPHLQGFLSSQDGLSHFYMAKKLDQLLNFEQEFRKDLMMYEQSYLDKRSLLYQFFEQFRR